MIRRLVAVAVVLVASTLLPVAGATAGTEPDPMAGAPAVGDCFDITYKQGGEESHSSEPVRCSTVHTAAVMTVEKLPSRLDWDSSKAQIKKAVSARCSAALERTIGKDQLGFYRSQYLWLWFQPTAAQVESGARWYDCLVAVSDDRGLAALPTRLPKVTGHLPNSVARCVTADGAYTTCADRHDWRSTWTFYATGRASERNAERAAKRTCPKHVRGRTWLWSSWDVQGKRFVVGCYSKTRR